MRISRASLALALVAMAAFASLASADTVTARLDGLSLSTTANVSALNSASQRQSAYVYVGQFDWSIPNSNETFHTFCIDMQEDVNFGWTYTYETAALGASPVTGANLGVNWSIPEGMGLGKANLITKLWADDHQYVVDNASAAAFQLAIWNIIYDGSNDWNVSDENGNFRVAADANNGTLTSAISTANSWLGGLQSWVGANPRTWNQPEGTPTSLSLIALTGRDVQDQVMLGATTTSTALRVVPTPTASWAGLSLLGAIMAYRRYTKRYAD